MGLKMIRIENTDGIGNNTKITDVETGRRVERIERVDIKVVAQEPVRIRLTLCDGRFLFEGKPELTHDLATVGDQIRGKALLAERPTKEHLVGWADAIDKVLAAAAGSWVE